MFTDGFIDGAVGSEIIERRKMIEERKRRKEKEEMALKNCGDNLGKMRIQEEAGGEEGGDKRKEKDGKRERNKQEKCEDTEKRSPGVDAKMRLEDLSQECLMEILERLSQANLLKMARVNKRMNKLVEDKLRVKIKKVVVAKSKWKNLNDLWSENEFLEDEVVHLDPMFTRMLKDKVTDERANRKDLHKAPAKDMLLKMLTRFSGIKSIDFGKMELTSEVLKEMAKICPEIESININCSVVAKDVWDDFFGQFGHQIVYLGWIVDEVMPTTPSRMLNMIVSKCPNLKRVKFLIGIFTDEFIALLKRLPKTCLVCLLPSSTSVPPLHDTVDYLYTTQIDLSILGKVNKRLKRLWLLSIKNPLDTPFRVKFASLKELSYLPAMSHPVEFKYLAESRFFRLEMFDFTANSNLAEDAYFKLFQKMPELKKLVIRYLVVEKARNDVIEDVLPGRAALQLKKLETLKVSVKRVILHPHAPAWKTTDFMNRLSWYVDEIKSMKLLLVEGEDNSTQQIVAGALEMMQKKRYNKRFIPRVALKMTF